MVLARDKRGRAFFSCSVCGFETGLRDEWEAHINRPCRPPPGQGMTRAFKDESPKAVEAEKQKKIGD